MLQELYTFKLQRLDFFLQLSLASRSSSSWAIDNLTSGSPRPVFLSVRVKPRHPIFLRPRHPPACAAWRAFSTRWLRSGRVVRSRTASVFACYRRTKSQRALERRRSDLDMRVAGRYTKFREVRGLGREFHEGGLVMEPADRRSLEVLLALAAIRTS